MATYLQQIAFEHCNFLACMIRDYQVRQKNAIDGKKADQAENAWKKYLSQLKFDCFNSGIDYEIFSINEFFSNTAPPKEIKRKPVTIIHQLNISQVVEEHKRICQGINCSNALTGKQEKYCCKACNSSINNKKRNK